MLYASLQERKPYNVFVPGDKVRFIKNLFWTDSANKNIGRTGTIKDVSYQGILKTYYIVADEIKTDKYGYVDSSFLAHEGEIEFCTIDDQNEKKVKSMNDTENYIVEFCPHCETENEIRWDTETEGYEAFCPHCGKRIMICSECLRAEDNELQKCDWFEEKCFRCREN